MDSFLPYSLISLSFNEICSSSWTDPTKGFASSRKEETREEIKRMKGGGGGGGGGGGEGEGGGGGEEGGKRGRAPAAVAFAFVVASWLFISLRRNFFPLKFPFCV
jgi:hypothetical protein